MSKDLSAGREHDALSGTIQEAMARLRVPGVGLGILYDDAEYAQGFGVTSVENPLPVDGDTLFQVGSITKTVTATAIMRLRETGRLSLDAPIVSYLPDFRLRDDDVAVRVTVRHLLQHAGGWLGDYFDDTGMGDDALAEYVRRMADLPQVTPLGGVWHYNNAGFSLAGRIIEVVTSMPYEAAIKDLVHLPVGMAMSFFFAHDAIPYRVAVGHHVAEQGEPAATRPGGAPRDSQPHQDGPAVARPWWLARSAHPAGGLISTARDQLKYARFHLGYGTGSDGTRLLSADALTLMQTPQVDAGDSGKVGLSWFVREVAGTRIITHGGATKGQTSVLLLVPQRRFGIAVLTNADRGAALHREVTKWALKYYLALEQPEPQPIQMDEQALGTYTGIYESALTRLELSLENGSLVLRSTPKGGFPTKETPPPPAPPPARLAVFATDRVVVTQGPMKELRGEFLRDAHGEIAWFRIGGRLHARY